MAISRELVSFPINTTYRAGVEVAQNTPSQRLEFLTHFESAVSQIDDICGPDEWMMVGGIARDAYLKNKEFVVTSPNAAWRDIDIVTTSKGVDRFRMFGNDYNGPLSIGGGALSSCLYIPENGPVVLKYGKIREEVPAYLFNPTSTQLGNISFPSVPIQTLLHLYAIGDRPNGKMREKDFLNALDIARYISQNPDCIQFDEEEYAPFHSFARRKNVRNERGVSHHLRSLAIRYKESAFNNMLPIDNPLVLNYLKKMWSSLCDIENKIS